MQRVTVMFRACFFPLKKSSTEKKARSEQSKKKNKNSLKTIIKEAFRRKPASNKVVYGNNEESSATTSSPSSIHENDQCLVGQETFIDAELDRNATVTLSDPKNNIPRKLSIDFKNLECDFHRLKDCLRKTSSSEVESLEIENQTTLLHMVTPMEPRDQPTPLLVDTPIRRLPKYRLRTVRRRLFQESSLSFHSSISSMLSGVSSRTQTNQTDTVSSSPSFESFLEINVSFASSALTSTCSLMSETSSGRIADISSIYSSKDNSSICESEPEVQCSPGCWCQTPPQPWRMRNNRIYLCCY